MVRYQHPVDESTYDSSDAFGNIRANGKPHLGSDYKVPVGTPVCAIADGVITHAQWSSVLGNVIGENTSDKFVGYAHLSSVTVKPGDVVTRGQVIGYSGDTGSASTGAHLHVSIGSTVGAVFGEGYGVTLVNPYEYIKANSGSDTLTESDIDMSEISYYALQQDGKSTLYGIFGQTLPGGFRESTDVNTARAWGKLYGTKVFDAAGRPVRVGGPHEYLTDPTLWTVLKRESESLSKAYFATITA